MKKIQKLLGVSSLILLLWSTSVWALPKTLVITDIDDTIRSLNVRSSYLNMLDNALDSSRAFSGMSEILNILDQEGASIYYVSAVVEPFVGYSEEFLETNDFPQMDQFYHRGWFQDTYDFKLAEVERIIKREKPELILLLGDNADKDVAVYRQIGLRYSQVITFIHKVYPDSIDSHQNIYLTGADLAVSLEEQGLLSSENTKSVLEKIEGDINSGDAFIQDMVWSWWAMTTVDDVEQAFSATSQDEQNQMLLLKIKQEVFSLN